MSQQRKKSGNGEDVMLFLSREEQLELENLQLQKQNVQLQVQQEMIKLNNKEMEFGKRVSSRLSIDISEYEINMENGALVKRPQQPEA